MGVYSQARKPVWRTRFMLITHAHGAAAVTARRTAASDLQHGRRYETGFNGYGGSSFSTAQQYIAFANGTMLTRLGALIKTSASAGGVAPVIGEWGLAGDHPRAEEHHEHRVYGCLLLPLFAVARRRRSRLHATDGVLVERGVLN